MVLREQSSVAGGLNQYEPDTRPRSPSEDLAVQTVLLREPSEEVVGVARELALDLEVCGLGEGILVGFRVYVLVVGSELVQGFTYGLKVLLILHIPRAQHRIAHDYKLPEIVLAKHALLLQELPVGVQFATFAEVADQIPVHARLVLAAGFLVGAANGEVYRAAKLFVEEYVLSRPWDAVVRSDPELPQIARPLISVEHRVQVFLPFLRTRVDGPPVLEPQPHTGNLATGDRDGDAEVDCTVYRVLDGTREDLTTRHVVCSVAVEELSVFYGEGKVRPRTADAYLIGLLQPLDEPLLFFGLLTPVPHRVLFVQGHCLEDELLVVFEAHLRLLGEGLRREERECPAILAQDHLLEGLVSLAQCLLLLRVHRCQGPGVPRGHDRDEGVGVLVDRTYHGGRLFVVMFFCMPEEELLHTRYLNLGDRYRPCVQQPRVHLLDQGLRRHPAGDEHLLALPRSDGVIDQHPRELPYSLVPHGSRSFVSKNLRQSLPPPAGASSTFERASPHRHPHLLIISIRSLFTDY